MNAASYGCKTYKATTVEELKADLEDAEKQTVSTLIDIKVLPKTMLHGYGHWWRVGQPQVSKSETVRKAYEALKVELAKARQY